VRDVIRNFNADGFGSLYPRYKGGHPPKFTLAQRREIKKLARSHRADHGLPFSTWSLSKLAEFLVAEGVIDDISHEGLRIVLREEGCLSTAENLEGLQRPALRGEEGKGRAPVLPRRP
jgi:transposase